VIIRGPEPLAEDQGRALDHCRARLLVPVAVARRDRGGDCARACTSRRKTLRDVLPPVRSPASLGRRTERTRIVAGELRSIADDVAGTELDLSELASPAELFLLQESPDGISSSEAIARLVRLIAGDDAASITGQVIRAQAAGTAQSLAT
jgi:hypothetical protein